MKRDWSIGGAGGTPAYPVKTCVVGGIGAQVGRAGRPRTQLKNPALGAGVI